MAIATISWYRYLKILLDVKATELPLRSWESDICKGQKHPPNLRVTFENTWPEGGL